MDLEKKRINRAERHLIGPTKKVWVVMEQKIGLRSHVEDLTTITGVHCWPNVAIQGSAAGLLMSVQEAAFFTL